MIILQYDVLLGLVIEHVTGSPIADVFQERIFGPLGMDNTILPTGTTDITAPYLSGLTAQGQPTGKTADATNWSPSIAFTAGEIVSTLDDLAIWGAALFTGNGILDPATQQLRRDSIITDIPPMTPQSGYGIGIGDKDGWWGHEGGIPGYNTMLFHNYELDTTVIVVVNSDIGLGDPAKPTTPASAVFNSLKDAIE